MYDIHCMCKTWFFTNNHLGKTSLGQIWKSNGHYLQTLPILFSGSAPPQSNSLGHHLSQLQPMWLGLVRSKHSEQAHEETDWWRNAQQMSTASWLLGHHRVNHCRHWRRRRTSQIDIENRQLSRQFSRCSSWSRKNVEEELRGKSVADWEEE